jgi:hypothetical protein
MTMKRNSGPVLMVAGLAAALLLYRMQGAGWAHHAPSWHRIIREGDLTVCALLVALIGLYLTLRR